MMEEMEGNQLKRLKELVNISDAIGDLFLDIAKGRLQLEEATIDTGTFRTVLRVSVVPTDKLREDLAHKLKN
ncbi:MAG: hypothetical protein COB65_06350 [Thalassobium sp.]|nr:MAG: hypothetical protein COB65_06350 [Thalassobium sp.]